MQHGQSEERQSTAHGRHDFDFWVGTWRGANRKRVNPLVLGDDEWIAFEGWCEARPILGGLGSTDEFSAPDFPGRPGFAGFSLRLFEPETELWRIWWASTLSTGEIDPPVIGRFHDGIGRFECDEVIEDTAVKVRYEWKDIGGDSARWEQSFSFDEGATWDTNWTVLHTRVAGVTL